MAESLAEKLKRLAREKAEAKAKAEVSTVAEVTEVANVQPVEEKVDVQSESVVDGIGSSGTISNVEVESQSDGELRSVNSDQMEGHSLCLDTVNIIQDSGSNSSNSLPVPAGPTHPLTMQFMELEQALDSTDASFKVKLRDIHRHLGKDPDLVTQMTEAEIALVVKGLVIFANAEIVEPAKAKTVKAATAAAKKKVISADDL